MRLWSFMPRLMQLQQSLLIDVRSSRCPSCHAIRELVWGGVGWDGDPITSFDTNKDVPSTIDEAQGNVLPDDHAVSLKRDPPCRATSLGVLQSCTCTRLCQRNLQNQRWKPASAREGRGACASDRRVNADCSNRARARGYAREICRIKGGNQLPQEN